MRDIWKDNVFLLLGDGAEHGKSWSLENKMNYSPPHTHTHTNYLKAQKKYRKVRISGLQILTNVVRSGMHGYLPVLDAKQNDKNWGLLPLQSWQTSEFWPSSIARKTKNECLRWTKAWHFPPRHLLCLETAWTGNYIFSRIRLCKTSGVFQFSQCGRDKNWSSRDSLQAEGGFWPPSGMSLRPSSCKEEWHVTLSRRQPTCHPAQF